MMMAETPEVNTAAEGTTDPATTPAEINDESASKGQEISSENHEEEDKESFWNPDTPWKCLESKVNLSCALVSDPKPLVGDEDSSW